MGHWTTLDASTGTRTLGPRCFVAKALSRSAWQSLLAACPWSSSRPRVLRPAEPPKFLGMAQLNSLPLDLQYCLPSSIPLQRYCYFSFPRQLGVCVTDASGLHASATCRV